MIVFVAYANLGWGKGSTLTQAMTNLHKNTTVEDKFGLAIYEAEDIDEVYVTDFMEIHRGKNDKQLYHSEETKINLNDL